MIWKNVEMCLRLQTAHAHPLVHRRIPSPTGGYRYQLTILL